MTRFELLLLTGLLSISLALSSSTSQSMLPVAQQTIGGGSGPPTSSVCLPTRTVVCDPLAITFDSGGNLWVADGQDNRVLEFPSSGGQISSSSSAVIGQKNYTSSTCGAGTWPAGMRSSTLCFPDGLAFDAGGDLWVADGGGNRVVEFPLVEGKVSATPTEVIGPNFTAFAPETPPQGFLLPVGLAFDSSGNLWVADLSHSRILEFPLVHGHIALQPSRVIGQNGMGGGFCNQTLTAAEQINATATDLCFPSGVAFDSSGDLWVADFGLNQFAPGNSRVMMFPNMNGNISSVATEVVGQPSFTGYGCNGGYNLSSRASLCLPVSIAFDARGNLWVADSGNNRVLEFPTANGSVQAFATTLIGQSNYNSHICNQNGPAATGSTLCRPLALAFDRQGDLWVSDTDNYRILEFTSAVPADASSSGLWLIGVVIAGVFSILIAWDLSFSPRPDVQTQA